MWQQKIKVLIARKHNTFRLEITTDVCDLQRISAGAKIGETEISVLIREHLLTCFLQLYRSSSQFLACIKVLGVP